MVDFSTEIAGGYATKLFADAGADVVKVETVDGDPLRRRSASGADLGGKDSALFRYLHAGKRSVVGAPTDRDVLDLVAGADLVVESFVPARFDPLEWVERFPGLVVLSITPYGRTGPWADRPATDFIVQAESGSILGRGRPDQVPYQAGARLMEWTGGLYSACAAMAAIYHASRTGRGDHVDCALIEVTTFSTTFHNAIRTSFGHEKAPVTRMSEVPSIEQTKDGFVGFNTNTRQQFEDFLAMIGHPEMFVDDTWANFYYRCEHHEEFYAFVDPWMREHTTAEIVELAALFRIPVAPVLNGATVADNEQLAARGMFVSSPDGEFMQPAAPYLLDGERPRSPGLAPRLGQQTGTIESHSRSLPARHDEAQLPLAGLRVVDSTAWWAGPSASQVLAGLGADVIHIESIQRPDNMRFGAEPTIPEWWEESWMFFGTNFNKRDLTLDLSRSVGRELLERLIATSDMVLENYSPRVFESFGLDHDAVLAINPNVIFAWMPAFGLSGPWRERVGFAQTMEQLTGLAWLTGHADDQPRIPRGPCDPLSGYHALFATLVALYRRDVTGEGKGARIESGMLEATMAVAAESMLEYSAYGAVLERDGNRGTDAAPQGLYACRGEENWLAVAIVTDEHWAALKATMGKPPWAEDERLESFAGRREHHDLVDREIEAWARDQDVAVIVDDLVARGVPAGAATDPWLTADQPQLAARATTRRSTTRSWDAASYRRCRSAWRVSRDGLGARRRRSGSTITRS